MYVSVCERWRVDPAAFLEDDYLAFQLRMALAFVEEPEAPKDPFAETRVRAQELMDRA